MLSNSENRSYSFSLKPRGNSNIPHNLSNIDMLHCFSCKTKKKIKRRTKKQPKGDEEKDSLLHSISNELNVSNNNNIFINKEVPLSWCERFKEVFYNIFTLNLCIAIIFITLMKIGDCLFIVSISCLFFCLVSLCELMVVVFALFR